DALQFIGKMEVRIILVLFFLLSWGYVFRRCWWNTIRKTRQVLLQLLVALGHPSLVGVIHLEFLLQHKDELWAPGTFEAFGNLCSAGLNPRMTEFREFPWVPFSVDNGPHNHLSGHPTQIADHIGKLNIHLRQRFLHALYTCGRPGDMLQPLPPVGAQGPNL